MTIEILYFGLFAVSFNLLFGYAGLLSFGHAATFGIGGYTVGLALKHIALGCRSWLLWAWARSPGRWAAL